MSEKAREEISALVDGELAEASLSETVDVLLESDELKTRWARYHVVRDVLRHKTFPTAGEDLRERVLRSLADEPHHLSRPRVLPRRWREHLKPVAGMALAASVAVVAVLAVKESGPVPPDVAGTQPAPTSVATTGASSVTGAAIPVAAIQGGDIRPSSLRRLHWSTDEPAVAQRLNGYLVNHSEHQDGPMAGLHPYARIVGYDPSEQP